MARIIIARGQHPQEISAMYLARKVAEKLRQNHEVEEVRMPFKRGFLYSLLQGPNQDGYLRGDYSASWANRLDDSNPDKFIFNFHNSAYNPGLKKPEYFGFSEYEGGPMQGVEHMRHDDENGNGLTSWTIEIPAIYKPVTDPRIVRSIELLRRQGWPNAERESNRLARKYSRIVDFEATMKEGLVCDSIVHVVASGIEQIVHKNC